jgi:hypothetical protein
MVMAILVPQLQLMPLTLSWWCESNQQTGTASVNHIRNKPDDKKIRACSTYQPALGKTKVQGGWISSSHPMLTNSKTNADHSIRKVQDAESSDDFFLPEIDGSPELIAKFYRMRDKERSCVFLLPKFQKWI